MAGQVAIIEDSSLLSRLDIILLKLERFCALISGLTIFSLMFLAVYSVSGRKFFNAPLAGYVDYIEAALPVIAIMGVSYVQRDGSHIRMDIFVSLLKGRALWLFELISILLILLLILYLTWGAWLHFDRSFDCSRPLCSRDSSIDIGLPTWPSKLVVPFAFTVLSFRLILQAVGYSRALIFDLKKPPAVPLPISSSDQAKIETEAIDRAI
jgi:TRAP-type C4-dicarboxylate transport system permease small subunit|tara:strand:+ start:644 stop:1273 length:630 start_codon:yes stop_codon:yes gene_type:complete